MNKEIFSKLVHQLTDISPEDSPLISCFVNLDHPRSDYLHELKAQADSVAKCLGGRESFDFDLAFDAIREYLKYELNPSSKSVAIYSRYGEKPIFLAMQFEVPLESQLLVDKLPHIYPLIELKDVYHRFVVAILTDKESRIIETTIGSVTEEILEKRPELRMRVGREWSKEHYRNYRDEQTHCFVKEKVDCIERLVNKGGHNHLILAGSPKMVARLKHALPVRLKAKLIDTLSANPSDGISPILAESMKLFIAMEEIESYSRVEELEVAVFSNGLGVCGVETSLAALKNGSARMLIIDQNILELKDREELVRLATKAKIPIETVSQNKTMLNLGGVGCLLRYLPFEAAEIQVPLVA